MSALVRAAAARRSLSRVVSLFASASSSSARPRAALPFPRSSPVFKRAVLLSSGIAAAALGAYAATALSDASPAGDTYTDPSSQLKFPTSLELDPRYGIKAQQLLGTGCRYKYGWFQVYVVGLYMDPASIKDFKSQYSSSAYKTLQENQAFYDQLCSVTSPRTLVLKLRRAIDVPTFTGALHEALAPRVETFEPQSKQGQAALASFKQMLTAAAGLQFVEGAEVRLILAPPPPGTSECLTHIQVDGKGVGCVRSSALAWALMDTYLGKESVAPELKTSAAYTCGAH